MFPFTFAYTCVHKNQSNSTNTSGLGTPQHPNYLSLTGLTRCQEKEASQTEYPPSPSLGSEGDRDRKGGGCVESKDTLIMLLSIRVERETLSKIGHIHCSIKFWLNRIHL